MSLIIIAFYTLAERKIMASVQRRVGPNVNGYEGLLQPFADGLKLLIKEIIIPYGSNLFIFLFSPVLFLTLGLVSWSLIPWGAEHVLVDGDYTALLLYAVSSMSVYGIIFSGWASNSKYALLGSLRSAAQMISYEISLGFIYLTVIACTGTASMYEFMLFQNYNSWLCFFLLPLVPIFMIIILAETNRAPFDLPESEAELVAGYNVEYSSIAFAMFYLGEYANIFVMSYLMVTFFFGGWLISSISLFTIYLKASIILVLFILIRAALPRYRYDQLMAIGWCVFLPLTTVFFIFLVSILLFFDGVLVKNLFVFF
jgi:NADH-quinone oxidoreductase subunit H